MLIRMLCHLFLLDNPYSIHKVARLASLDKIFKETTTQKKKRFMVIVHRVNLKALHDKSFTLFK